MDINQLLNELKETYSFSNATYTQTPGETMTDFVFCLTQDQITRFIQKASRLTSIVESCANMISICEPGLKDTLMQLPSAVWEQTSCISAPVIP